MHSAIGVVAAVLGTNSAVVRITVDSAGGWMMALGTRRKGMAGKATLGRHGAGGKLVWPRV